MSSAILYYRVLGQEPRKEAPLSRFSRDLTDGPLCVLEKVLVLNNFLDPVQNQAGTGMRSYNGGLS
jgi:hypothetical protein